LLILYFFFFFFFFQAEDGIRDFHVTGVQTCALPIFRSFVITLLSFIPLFYFGIWKRVTIPTVLCGIIVMQSHLVSIIDLNFNIVLTVLTILGGISIFLSITTADKFGEM